MSILNQFKLAGKKAFVTGGAQGIGKQFSLALAEAGADVAIVDINLEKAEKSAEEISQKTGQQVIAVKTDVTSEDDVNEMINKIIEDFGTIDIAFNNAGITDNTPAEEMSVKSWDKLMNLNLKAVFLCTQAAGKVMLKNGGGSIINTASMSGHIVNLPQPQLSYNASKAAVIHLSKSFAVEWAEKNVRVNTISPGYMSTELLQSEELQPLVEKWEELTPMKRIGNPEELKGIAVYLASEASSYTTASDFVVDGGYTAV